MHKFLRAIGFSGIYSRESMQTLIEVTIKNSGERLFTTYEGDTLLAEYSTFFGPGIGLTVCGEMTNDEKFIYEYSFPYFRADLDSSREMITVERHAANISFAGVCDDERVGITIIFYLQNRIPYVIKKSTNTLPDKGTILSLTGLSLEGTIVMPLLKKPKEVQKVKDKSGKNVLFSNGFEGVSADREAEARAASSDAHVMDDLEMYTRLSKRLKDNDIYSIVDTYFMPYGVECDQYSVLGEILKFRLVKNVLTNEEVYQILLLCNEIKIAVSINKSDLLGEPQVGRRFKGNIWLQGNIKYPD